MKRLIPIGMLSVLAFPALGQIPPSGVYTYRIKWAEWQGKEGPLVRVKISGDSVFIYALDNTLTLIKKGELFEKGKLQFHKKSKQWIIAKMPHDKDADEVGGCSDGPTVIDFRHKWYWQC